MLLSQVLNKSSRVLSSIPFVIGICLLLFPLALRSKYVGTDTYNYYEIFYLISSFSHPFDYEYTEPGYILLNKIVGDFNYGAPVVIFTAALITLMLFSIFIWRYSSNYLLSISTLCGLSYYSLMYNTVRQFIAMGIAYLALHYLLKNKILLYIALVILATSFHYSAAIFFLAYIIIKYNYNHYLAVLFWIISLFFIIPAFSGLLLSVISHILPSQKYQVYIDSGLVDSPLTMRFILNQLMILLFIVFIWLNRDKKFDTNTTALLYLTLFGCLLDNILFNVGFVGRASLYFQVISIVAIPVLIKRSFKFKSYYIICIFLFIMFTSAYFRSITLQASGFAPYAFLWNY